MREREDLVTKEDFSVISEVQEKLSSINSYMTVSSSTVLVGEPAGEI